MNCRICNPWKQGQGYNGWMYMEEWPRNNKQDIRPRQWICRNCGAEDEIMAIPYTWQGRIIYYAGRRK